MEYLRRRLSDGNFLAGGGRGPPWGGARTWGGAGGGWDVETPPDPPSGPTAARHLPSWHRLGEAIQGQIGSRGCGAASRTGRVLVIPGRFWGSPWILGSPQAQFSELSLVASTHGALSITIDTPRGGTRRVHPDFVLVRECPEGGAEGATRRLLVGLQLGGVPSTDPLPALYAFAHPPCLFAKLAQLQRELGPEAFPLVPQGFCNHPRGLLTAPTFPMMVTFSPAPAGVGKVATGGWGPHGGGGLRWSWSLSALGTVAGWMPVPASSGVLTSAGWRCCRRPTGGSTSCRCWVPGCRWWVQGQLRIGGGLWSWCWHE
ncbi:synapsin-2-like isoform X2 [Falco cherrug]|uniref:synapsin-2-like isoform X2 n=1 Tax=Falco cherrug TaxID=345164 RepID=UPI002479C704|nr:synapsin-2-like isoform X2 [Falco cherrug]